MRTTTRKALTMNHNAVEMKEKYDISHMIAAFGYEEVCVIAETGNESYKWGNEFPLKLMHGLWVDLSKMAGWFHPDNKVTFLVQMGHEVALICFWDFRCTLVK